MLTRRATGLLARCLAVHSSRSIRCDSTLSIHKLAHSVTCRVELHDFVLLCFTKVFYSLFLLLMSSLYFESCHAFGTASFVSDV